MKGVGRNLRGVVVGRVVRETTNRLPGTAQPLIHERAVASSLGVNLDYHRQATGDLRELGAQIDSVLALLGDEKR